MKPIIRTPYAPHPHVHDVVLDEQTARMFFEYDTAPSLTVPDQTMTVKEILDRYAKGLPLSGGKVPIYEPDSDLPDPRTLDLAERQELAERYSQELIEIKQREQQLKIAKGDADKAASEAAEEERYKRFRDRMKSEEEKPA